MIFLVIGYNVIKCNGFDNDNYKIYELNLKIDCEFCFILIVFWNYEKRSPVMLPDQDEEKKIMNFMNWQKCFHFLLPLPVNWTKLQ